MDKQKQEFSSLSGGLNANEIRSRSVIFPKNSPSTTLHLPHCRCGSLRSGRWHS